MMSLYEVIISCDHFMRWEYLVVMAPYKLKHFFRITKMATGSGVTSNELEKLLEKVGLGNLLSSFVHEKLDCQTLLGLSEKELIRLGVNTIGDRVRLRQACRDHQAYHQHGNADNADRNNGLNLVAGYGTFLSR